MTIERIRINGMENPVGFWMEDVRVSFVVKGSAGKKAEKICVQIGDTPDFAHICAEKSGADLDSACVPFPFSFLPCTRYYVRVFVRSDIGEEAWSDGTAFFETARGEEPWAGTWISPQEEDAFHPVFVPGAGGKRDGRGSFSFSLTRGISGLAALCEPGSHHDLGAVEFGSGGRAD